MYNGQHINIDPIELSTKLPEFDYEEYLDKEYFEFNSKTSSWNKYWSGLGDMSFRFNECNIYFFRYYVKRDLSLKDVYDFLPMVFVLGVVKKENNMYIKGINLNYMKKEVKLKFLHLYYKYFKNTLVYDTNNHEKGYNNLTKFQRNDINDFLKDINTFIPNLSLYLRTWKIKDIDLYSVMFVKYIDYNILPFYNGQEKSIDGNLIA